MKQILAAALVMAGLLLSRHEVIIGGQNVPPFEGIHAPELLPCSPSTGEWAPRVLAVGPANTGYAPAAGKPGAENRT